MPDFKDLEKLKQYILKNMTTVLEKEVFEAIREEMIETIEDEVYGEYNPTQYIRKESRGGLKDPRNIKGYIVNGKLMVRNERKDTEGKTNKNVAEIVEYGTGYDWADSKIYGMMPFPRPFMKMTTLRLIGNSKHIIAMIKGLKSKGIQCE